MDEARIAGEQVKDIVVVGAGPAGLSAASLPVGLQIAGPRFAEPLILGLGKLVQRAHPLPWPYWVDEQ